jgi:hypothetical protein
MQKEVRNFRCDLLEPFIAFRTLRDSSNLCYHTVRSYSVSLSTAISLTTTAKTYATSGLPTQLLLLARIVLDVSKISCGDF